VGAGLHFLFINILIFFIGEKLLSVRNMKVRINFKSFLQKKKKSNNLFFIYIFNGNNELIKNQLKQLRYENNITFCDYALL
jgi:hypothetical protein